MWSSSDVIGLFSNNVVSFSRNVVLRDPLFSLNSVSNPRMLSVRTVYVLSSLHLYVPASLGRGIQRISCRVFSRQDHSASIYPTGSEVWSFRCPAQPYGTSVFGGK